MNSLTGCILSPAIAAPSLTASTTREFTFGFTGGGAGKDHGQVYLDGEPHHRIENDQILDHLVELVEKKAAEIKAREEKESVAEE